MKQMKICLFVVENTSFIYGQSSFQLYLKPNGYIARFIRRDEKGDEEYYYLAYGDALNHLALFKNDNSGLYKRIEIVDSRSLLLPYVVLDFQDMNCLA